MYRARDDFSSTLRQGDILEGRAISWPDLQVKWLRDLGELATGTEKQKLSVAAQASQVRVMILSQCCDLRDSRVLVGQLLPKNTIRMDGLTEVQRIAFEANELGDGVELSAGELGATSLSEATFVFPGYFHLAQLAGVIDEAAVVSFALMRGIRRTDLELLTKIAELDPGQRARLRRRVAVFFGRVPEEDVQAPVR